MATNYRALCFEEHGDSCALCDTSENVVAHHINGDRSDNRPENLMPTCRTCHAQIHAGVMEELAAQLPPEARIDRPERWEDAHSLTNLTISVSDELADELYTRKKRGDSYEDVIWRLIEEAEGE